MNWLRRRKFRFGLRTCLLMVGIAGLAFAWIASARRQRDLIAAVVKSNPSATIDYDARNHRARPATGWQSPLKSTHDWLAHRLGADYLSSPRQIALNYPIDADLAWIARLTCLHSLTMYRAIDLTDAGLERLQALGRLQSLTIVDGDQLTDRGLESLGRLTSLVELRLDVSRRMTPRGLLQLASLTNLRHLELAHCGQAGIYGESPLDDATIERLARALPNCRIVITPLERPRSDRLEREQARVESPLRTARRAMALP